ncbi:MAG: pentapeptide repeat-containing protein [bacterium]|nr:pentapeptide repeat-containing protein [bacterium]
MTSVSTFLKRFNNFMYFIVGVSCGVLIFPFLSYISTDSNNFLKDLVPEATSIFFTVLILDRINQKRSDEKRKSLLVEQLGSKINLIAVSAAEQLWARHWWWDGTLSKAQLEKADLRGIDFTKANLTGARLAHPRYGKATFDETTILPDERNWSPDIDMTIFTDKTHPNYWRGYGLRRTKQKGVNFEGANLRGADLRECDFRDANFKHADLSGARFEKAHLKGANFTHAIFTIKTTMPDGTTWHPEIDLTRYGAIIQNGNGAKESL